MSTNIKLQEPYGQHFLWDLNNTKWCNHFYIEFRQHFTKETFPTMNGYKMRN